MTSTEQAPQRGAGHAEPHGQPCALLAGTGPELPCAMRSVVRRMREIDAELPRRDGVAVFNRVYLSVTEELQRGLESGSFTDRSAAEELCVRFAGRFLRAVEASETGSRTPASWRPLFQLRRHPSVRPLQFAMSCQPN